MGSKVAFDIRLSQLWQLVLSPRGVPFGLPGSFSTSSRRVNPIAHRGSPSRVRPPHFWPRRLSITRTKFANFSSGFPASHLPSNSPRVHSEHLGKPSFVLLDYKVVYGGYTSDLLRDFHRSDPGTKFPWGMCQPASCFENALTTSSVAVAILTRCPEPQLCA